MILRRLVANKFLSPTKSVNYSSSVNRQAEDAGSMARFLTRWLAKAKLEVKGEAMLDWDVESRRFPSIGLLSRRFKSQDDRPMIRNTTQMRFRVLGQLEFTETSFVARIPGPLMNGFLSVCADFVLKALMPQFLGFLSADFQRWAKGEPRGMKRGAAAVDLESASTDPE